MSNPQSAMGEAIYRPARRRFQITLRVREALVAYLFLVPFFIFFIVFVLRAVVYAFQMSFYDWKILALKHPYIGLGNYQELLGDAVWWTSLKNTLIMAILIVVGTTIVALFAAVALNRPLKGGNFFRVLLYAPSLLSVGVVGTTWQWLLNTQFGIINYGLSLLGFSQINWLGSSDLVLPAISLTTIWWGFGFPMLIFLAGLQGIPETLYEAARIDGANGRQLFFYITLPLLRPTILFVTVTGFIANFQIFGQNYIMTSGGPGYASFSVIFYLYQKAWQGFRMGYGATIAIALAVIIMVFTVTQFRLLGRRVEY
ncbi:MAG TPA: sugar ABC transporter permease [Phototrophicaceae bacterium]|nr:sugar ABC transporter permease [Phototrophicaceae bacterium]